MVYHGWQVMKRSIACYDPSLHLPRALRVHSFSNPRCSSCSVLAFRCWMNRSVLWRACAARCSSASPSTLSATSRTRSSGRAGEKSRSAHCFLCVNSCPLPYRQLSTATCRSLCAPQTDLFSRRGAQAQACSGAPRVGADVADGDGRVDRVRRVRADCFLAHGQLYTATCHVHSAPQTYLLTSLPA